MTARLYSLATDLTADQKKYVGGLRGQARIVYDELARVRTPRLAEDINKETRKLLVTRQDYLRVTLYYIIVFKGRGIVVAHEPTRTPLEVAVEATPETVPGVASTSLNTELHETDSPESAE